MSDSPSVAVVRVVPKPGQTEAVLEVMREVVPIVHGEDGCLLYSVNVHENGDIYFIEKWESLEHSERHGQSSPVLPILIEKTTPLLAGPPEITNLKPFPIGGAKGAL